MHLDPLLIQVLPRLSHTGSSESTQGVLLLPSIDIGHRHFALAEGIAYDALLTNTSEAILLTGKARAEVDTTCDRCLEPTKLQVEGELQGYYLFDGSVVEDGEGLEINEEVDRNGRVDIAPPVLAAIVIELPSVTLCSSDCSGLLVDVQEDADAEEEAAVQAAKSQAAEDKTAEDKLIASPFAALKDFKFED